MPYTQVKTFWGFPASEAGALALDNDINAWLASKPDVEVLHIGQSQSQAADHGSPRVTISIFYKSALLPIPPSVPQSQETVIINKAQQAKKGAGRTETATLSKSRPPSSKPTAPKPAPPPLTSLPGEDALLRRRKEVIRQLEAAAANVKTGDALRISLRDSLEIRRLQVPDFIDRTDGIEAAEKIAQAIQRGNFNPLGMALKGIRIAMIEDGPDLIVLG
jgi:hypothetical protein